MPFHANIAISAAVAQLPTFLLIRTGIVFNASTHDYYDGFARAPPALEKYPATDGRAFSASPFSASLIEE